jgi:hypothetical protein
MNTKLEEIGNISNMMELLRNMNNVERLSEMIAK